MTEPTPIPEDLRPIEPGEQRRRPRPPAETSPPPPAPARPPRRLEPASERLERPPLPE